MMKKTVIQVLICLFILCIFASCSNKEKPVEPIYGVTLDKNTIELEVGDEGVLTATALKDGVVDSTSVVIWSSSDNSVATVTDGVVQAQGVGVTTVTVSYNGKKAETQVVVTEFNPGPQVVLNKIVGSLYVGEQLNLNATVFNSEVKNVVWSVDDDTVSVENGLVTALKEGKAVITATHLTGAFDSCTITVKNKNELIFNDIESVFVGEETELDVFARLNNEVDEDAVISFEISPNSNASITDKKLTVTKSGEITITASYNGLTEQKTVFAWNKVSTKEEFLAIKNDMSENYLLVDNIDFEGAEIKEFASYNYVMNKTSPAFTGVFDGQGYSISNFKPVPTDSSQYNVSIFGYVDKTGVIKNVGFTGVILAKRSATVSSYLLGTVENVYLEATYTNTSVSGFNENNPASTLVGKVQPTATVKNCIVNLSFSEGAINTNFGMFASINSGVIDNCQVITSGTGYDNFGAKSSGTFTNSAVYSSADALYTANKDKYDSSIWCIEDGKLPYLKNMPKFMFKADSKPTAVKLITGGNNADVVPSFEVKECGTDYIGPYTYTVADDTVATMVNDKIHALKAGTTTIGVSVDDTLLGEFTVTVEDWIGIKTTQDFLNIKNDLTKNYILLNNIDFEGAELKQFSSYASRNTHKFTGVFDGDGYTVSNIICKPEKSDDYTTGIFGYVEGGTIKNVAFVNVTVEGRSGVVSSYFVSGTIENVFVKATYVKNTLAYDASTNNPAGILVNKDTTTNATIKDCVVYVEIGEGADTTYLGTLVATLTGTVKNCHVICSDTTIKFNGDGKTYGGFATDTINTLNDFYTNKIDEKLTYSEWLFVDDEIPCFKKSK